MFSQFRIIQILDLHNFIGSLGLSPIVSDYLTVSNGWFIMAEQAATRGVCRLNIFSGPSPVLADVPSTIGDKQLIDQLDMESGTMTWRGIYGSSS